MPEHPIETNPPESLGDGAGVGAGAREARSGGGVPQLRLPSSAFGALPPPSAFEPRSSFRAFLPLLYFGLLALVLVGSVAFLLWASPAEEGPLTDEELRLLAGARGPDAGTADGGGVAEGRGGSSLGSAAGTAILHVSTVPSGVRVAINGEVVGVTPLWLEDLPPRYHRVQLEGEEFGTTDTLVYLDEDVPTTLSVRRPIASVTLPASAAGGGVPAPAVEEPRSEVGGSAAAPEARSESVPSSGALSVTTNPPRTPVHLDGEAVGFTPLELDDVPVGPHTLTLFQPGFETATVHVEVEPGSRETVEVALKPQVGTLVVVVRPWGSVYVDDVLHARDTDVSIEVSVPAGRHRIRVEHPELGTQERIVEAQPHRSTPVVFDLN